MTTTTYWAWIWLSTISGPVFRYSMTAVKTITIRLTVCYSLIRGFPLEHFAVQQRMTPTTQGATDRCVAICIVVLPTPLARAVRSHGQSSDGWTLLSRCGCDITMLLLYRYDVAEEGMWSNSCLFCDEVALACRISRSKSAIFSVSMLLLFVLRSLRFLVRAALKPPLDLCSCSISCACGSCEVVHWFLPIPDLMRHVSTSRKMAAEVCKVVRNLQASCVHCVTAAKTQDRVCLFSGFWNI